MAVCKLCGSEYNDQNICPKETCTMHKLQVKLLDAKVKAEKAKAEQEAKLEQERKEAMDKYFNS